MKKTLLLTTALVGSMALAQAAMAQEATTTSTSTTTTTTETTQVAEKSPITVTLGGSAEFTAGLVDDSDITKSTGDSTRAQAMDTDVEAILYADAKTDSGLTYGAQIQLLKNDNDSEDGDDQQFAYLGGDWGKIEAGDADGAADKLAIYAPNDFGTGGVTGKYYQYLNSGTIFDGASGYTEIAAPNKRYKAFDSEAASKLSYYTPRFAGFQIGASYAPDGAGQGSRDDRVNEDGDLDSMTFQATNQAFENYVEVGANYETNFDDVGLAVGGSYVYAGAKGDYVDGADRYELEDLNAYQVGASVNFMGFTLGGGYVWQGNSGQFKDVYEDAQDSTAYNFGLQYETGPFIVGANALFAENQGYSSKDVQLDVYSVGATYIVAPGLSTFVEGTFVPANEGSYYDSNTDDAANWDSNSGSAIIVGTKVEF
jgi:outer membrane protein OmpU